MKIKGLHFCSFNPFEDNIRFRQHNNPEISFGTKLPIALDTYAISSTGASPYGASITIANNPNRALIILINYANNIITLSSVKLGSTSCTQIATHTSNNYVVDTYYITQTQGLGTGSQTITITFTGSNAEIGIGLVSLYNVNQSSPIGATGSGGADPGTNPAISVTPTITGSWIMAYVLTASNLSSPSNTQIYSNSGVFDHDAVQYNSSPTIGSSNTLSWTMASQRWSGVAFEIERA